MAKVKVTNICQDKQVAPSFKTLKPNMSTIVDDSIITPGDKRLEKRGLLKIEAYVPEGDENPKVVETRNIPDPKTKPQATEEKNKIITASDFDGVESKSDNLEIVTPGDLKEEAKEEVKEEVKEEAPIEEAPTEELPAVKTEVASYSKEELLKMTRDELRVIGDPLNVRGRSIDKLIEDILTAQAK